MIDFRDVRILYVREIRSALRERNILFNVVLMPLFLYPVFLWMAYTGISFVIGQTEDTTARVMVVREEGVAPDLEEEIRKAPKIEVLQSKNPAADIRAGDLDVLVEISAADTTARGNLSARFTYDASKDRSRTAHDRLSDLIEAYRSRFLEQQAEELGLSRSQYQQFWIESKNTSTGAAMGRFLLGMLVPMTLIVMIAVGGIYPALDSTAGERERNTWETLLTTGATRNSIVLSKYLYVASLSATAGLLNIMAMTFSARSLLAPLMGSNLNSISFSIPWASIPLILLFTVVLALYVAAGAMILATFARTYKEGQSMVGPFTLLTIMPAAVLQMPGIEFTTTLALIPVVNVSMVFREAIAGVYHWPQIGLALLVELAIIAGLLRLATVVLRYEDIFAGSYEGTFFNFLKERMGMKTLGKRKHS